MFQKMITKTRQKQIDILYIKLDAMKDKGMARILKQKVGSKVVDAVKSTNTELKENTQT